MRITRRTLAPLALPFALLCTFAGAAKAQATVISSPADGAYVNDTTPTVTYTDATPFTVVTLKVDDDVVATALSNGAGAGTITPTVAVDASPSSGSGFTVDDGGTAFGTVILHVNTVPDLSAVSSEPVDAADVQFDVTGAIPGNDIKLFDAGPDGAAGGGDDVLIKTTPADETGYSLGVTPTDPLPAGTHHVYAVTQDDGDTASSPSALATFDVAPASPRYADLASFDTAYLNQRMPVIGLAGVDPSASKVTLYEIEDVDGVGTLVEIGSTTTIVNSTPTVTPSSPGFADGQHSLVITQTVNGVESLSNGVADAGAVIDVLASAPELETSFSGTLTNDNAPYFYASNTLTNDDHTFMRLYIDGALAGRTDPDGSSDLQADQPIAEGPHTAYVVTVDDLGHQSVTPSNTVAFTIDSVAPVAPAVTSPADGSTTASSLPVVTITTEPGASAHVVIDDDSEEIDQTADANGHATFALTHPLADGKHALYAYSNDAAGNYGDVTTTSFIVATAKAPTAPAAPTSPAAPAAPAAPVDPDHDGIANDWMIGGKAAPSPGTPKASVSDGKVKLKLAAAPKGAKSIRVYRADGKGDYKLVKTLTPKSKTFTDAKVKPGHSYKYKTVGVNAKGQQGKASGSTTAKVKKTK